MKKTNNTDTGKTVQTPFQKALDRKNFAGFDRGNKSKEMTKKWHKKFKKVLGTGDAL